MSSRTSSVTRRTLHYFWGVTRIQLPMFVLDVAVTLGYVFFLTFASPLIVGQIVDMVGAGGVGPDEVLTAFGPYILALIGVNIAGQVCSKLQDYACAKLEIRAGYELGRLAFDTLSNQSMTFHTNRFGGSLVSSTQKFISAYSLLMDNFTYSALPTAATAVLTICMLAPACPRLCCGAPRGTHRLRGHRIQAVPQDSSHQCSSLRRAKPTFRRALGLHH